jgi:hypothetical protein
VRGNAETVISTHIRERSGRSRSFTPIVLIESLQRSVAAAILWSSKLTPTLTPAGTASGGSRGTQRIEKRPFFKAKRMGGIQRTPPIRSLNLRVAGSIPARLTIFSSALSDKPVELSAAGGVRAAPVGWAHCVLRDARSGRRRFRGSRARRTHRTGTFCA